MAKKRIIELKRNDLQVSVSSDLCVYFDTITLAFLAFQPKHTASASAAISEEFYAKVSDSKISSKLARASTSDQECFCTALCSLLDLRT